MSVDTSNVHNHNHSDRYDESIDQPPPEKRRKIQKQMFTEHKESKSLITKVSKKYDQTFSGIIDVERKNDIKRWMIHAKRERLKTDKLNEMLQVLCLGLGFNARKNESNGWFR